MPPAETVTVEKLVYGGEGLCRLPSGEIVFVPFTAPGETAAITVDPTSKKPKKGRLQELQQPAPQRVTPPCAVFGQCGGCHWQHLDLATQRQWKQAIVAESLQRLGKLPDVEVQPVIGSPEAGAWQYRNNVQWHVFTDASGQPNLGYQAAHSHQGVAFPSCPIMPETFQPVADTLRQHPQLLGQLSSVQVRQNTSGQLAVVLGSPHWTPSLMDLAVQTLSGLLNLTSLWGLAQDDETADSPDSPGCLWGEETFTESVRGKTFALGPTSFFQVNPDMMTALLDMLDSVLPETTGHLVDLYAGVGLFGLLYGPRAQAVTFVEASPEAGAYLQENLARHPLDEATAILAPAEQSLAVLPETADIALVDPPRAGCHPRVLDWLSQAITDRIVYISCNPTTLARDLRMLVDKGWHITLVQPFDFFPQTYHIETLAVLKRQA